MSDFFTHHFYAGARVEAQAGEAGKVLEAHGLHQGQMISANKTCPEGHKCFFNGCVFIKERRFESKLDKVLKRYVYRQVWWGDIDLNASQAALVASADALGRDLWVTRECYRWHGYHGEDEGVLHIKHGL